MISKNDSSRILSLLLQTESIAILRTEGLFCNFLRYNSDNINFSGFSLSLIICFNRFISFMCVFFCVASSIRSVMYALKVQKRIDLQRHSIFSTKIVFVRVGFARVAAWKSGIEGRSRNSATSPPRSILRSANKKNSKQKSRRGRGFPRIGKKCGGGEATTSRSQSRILRKALARAHSTILLAYAFPFFTISFSLYFTITFIIGFIINFVALREWTFVLEFRE